MRESLRPGVSERQLLALLQETNVEHGGHWSEYEIVVSGPRTNPWLDEASLRLIEEGDFVAFDTGMVGPGGYCADISRTFHCGPAAPTAAQRNLYRLAFEELQHNIALLRPGMSYREFSDRSWMPPAPYDRQRYPVLAHGVGMCDEHPMIVQPKQWAAEGIDGAFEPGMVISVESYIGAPGGAEGVKLEDQVLITAEGCEALSRFPFEEGLLR
jgi:Xaa-Pro aminopeptidase